MDPVEFLELADELLKKGTPACNRTAISRAYYGVLHGTLDQMERRGLPRPRQNELHQKTWDDLLNSSNPALAGAGSELGALKGVRNKADYQLADRIIESTKSAEYYVKLARDNFEIVKQVFTGPNAAGVVTAIQNYRKLVGRT